jgi:DNA polymerase
MGNQEIAILDWYLTMGVDEVVEETPQNRLQLAETKPIGEAVPQAKKTAVAPPIPDFSPNIAKAPLPAAQTAPAEALAKTEALAKAADSIEALKEAVLSFEKLSICRSATQPVFAQGVETPDVMVIGEAPGAQEDRQGIPFCGPSGQLLDKMLAAIRLSRQENTYITNSVFWRPPGNRTPTPEEIAICRPFVMRHIELIKPKLIFLLGGVAVRSVLNEASSISKLRGKTQSLNIEGADIPLQISYHPSYLLRQPSQKKLAWQDLLAIKAQLQLL